jgi:2,5-diamino-6-(ribosylamino)-4(3H)-pyrimidinone 5'-phosphate reductase
VILHNLVSLDGRVKGFPADIGLYYRVAAELKEDATLAGSGTIAQPGDREPGSAGRPPRPPRPRRGDRRPLLVVADSRGRVRSWATLRTAGYWRDLVALCSHATPPAYLDELRARGVDSIVTGADRVDLRAALEELWARYHVKVVRVDSGGTLNGALLRAGLVDEVSLIIAPYLVGGTSPESFFRAPDLTGQSGFRTLRLAKVEQLPGGLLWLRYRIAG